MAKVRVRLFATVREAAGRSEMILDVPDLASLLERLRAEFGRPMAAVIGDSEMDEDRVIVLVNGRNVRASQGRAQALSDEDEVALFPPVSGG